MSPPRIISYSLLTLLGLPTTCLHVNTSSKPFDSKDYHRSQCHHLATSILLYYYLLQVHRSTRRQNPQNHTLLQVNMSPPRNISHFLLLPITGLQVNTSSKLSEAYQYHRSPCYHLAIYLILYYYLLQVYRSTRRQNSQKHTITTGLNVTTSPYILISTTTYYISTGQHVVKALRIILYYKSPCPHLAIYLILYYYLLQVYRSTRRQNPQNHTITTGHHVPTSPYLILYYYLLHFYRSTCRHSPKNHTLLHVTMSPPRHISHSLLLPTTGLQVNTSSKPSEAYHYHRSPCPHLAIYLILHYHLPQFYRSTRRQNPQKHTITTGHHVPTSPYNSFSTTTYYRSTGQHVVKTPIIIPLLQVNMSPPHHISYSP